MIKLLQYLLMLALSSHLYASNITDKHQPMMIDHTTFTPQFRQEEVKKDHITIKAQYPLFTGTNLSSKAQRFNDIIQDIIETEIGQFSSLVWELNADREKNPGPQPPSGSDITIQYQILMTTAGDHPLLSILFTVDTFVSGAAHPNLTHRTINFDFHTGDAIAIADLFKPGVNFIPTLNNYCAKKLTIVTGRTRKEMEESNELNYAQWNITPTGLLIHFDEFAHVFGPQSVLIPYSDIKNVLNPNSPIKPCFDNGGSCFN